MYVEDNYKFIFRYVRLEDVSGTSNWCLGGGGKEGGKVSAAAMKYIIPRDNV